MRTRVSLLIATRLIATGLLSAALAAAQEKPQAPAASPPGGGIFKALPVVTGPIPHLTDGTVDLSGTWNGGGSKFK